MLKIWYKGYLVMTTEQLATILGTTPKNIQMNYTRNIDYFEEGKHYFKVTGEALKELRALINGAATGSKRQTTESGLAVRLMEEPDAADVWVPEPSIHKFASHLMLWTRRGVARHAKLLTTEQAWHIYEQMEDVYFAVVDEAQPRLKSAAKTEELPRAKSKYWRGQRVWTVQDVLEMYPMLTKDHIKYAAENVLTREDTYVLRGAELRQYKCENGMMKCKALRLVTERGLTKLAAYYNVEAAPSEAPAVTNFAEKINTAIRAMEAVTNVLRSLTA